METTPLPHADPVPLFDDGHGGLRVGASRVHLEHVIQKFDEGESPETIVGHYETLELKDVYAVLAYFLHHEAEVRAYIARQDARADAIREEIERLQLDRPTLRSRLLARRQQ